jgi:hypothetical protein
MKKRLLCVFIAIIAVLTFTACKTDDSAELPDVEEPNSTLLYVVAYESLFDIDWLRQMARNFEEIYKDYSSFDTKEEISEWLNNNNLKQFRV